jgi:hypothetical protein
VLDGEGEADPVPTSAVVVGATCEFEEVEAAEELAEEVEAAPDSELGVEEVDVVELELGAAVVETSGPSFAA